MEAEPKLLQSVSKAFVLNHSSAVPCEDSESNWGLCSVTGSEYLEERGALNIGTRPLCSVCWNGAGESGVQRVAPSPSCLQDEIPVGREPETV